MIKAVIQAGGLGTRISTITNNKIPKAMIEIDGYPVLYHQIINLKMNNINDIIIIVGFLGNVIKDYFGDGKKIGVNISYIEENPNNLLGTAGSLFYLKNKIDDDFIFLLADIFIDINFLKMIEFHKSHDGDITLFTHPNSHPYDSDLVVADYNNKVISFDSKNNDRSNYNYNNLVNAGVMIFSKNVLEYIKSNDKYSYEVDIVEPLIEKGMVYSYKSTEYAKDIGTPDRFNKVVADYYNGICAKKNFSNKQKAFFLDCDDIVNYNKNIISLKDNIVSFLSSINNSEYLCFVICNKYIFNKESFVRYLDTILGKKGVYIDEMFFYKDDINILLYDISNKYNIDLDLSIINFNNSFVSLSKIKRLMI